MANQLADSGADFIKRFMDDDVLTAVQKLKPIAEEAGLTMPQLAIAWVLQNPNVSSAIVGASRPEQVADNVTAAGVRLDPDLKKRIDDVLAAVAITDPTETANQLTSRPPPLAAGYSAGCRLIGP